MWTIRPETNGDVGAIDALVDASFGPGRYAKSAYRLRDGVDPQSGLMNKGIEEARARGYRAIILVGDLPYYSRVGFKPLARGKVKFPGPVDPSRILGLELVDGALDTLEGSIRRARIDHPVCADGAGLELA